MSDVAQVLVSHADAAWLPDGGRADVVLATCRAEVPRPTCLVRLLVTRDRKVLAVSRADDGGLDIPTLSVAEAAATEECLEALLISALGRVYPTSLLGYVRNVVPAAPVGYPWPAPDAYFVVWHCPLPSGVDADGEWLDPAEAEARLRDRHWWPLAAHVAA